CVKNGVPAILTLTALRAGKRGGEPARLITATRLATRRVASAASPRSAEIKAATTEATATSGAIIPLASSYPPANGGSTSITASSGNGTDSGGRVPTGSPLIRKEERARTRAYLSARSAPSAAGAARATAGGSRPS